MWIFGSEWDFNKCYDKYSLPRGIYKWKNLTFWKFIQTINLLLCRRQLYAKRYLLYYLCFLSTAKCRINLKIFKNVRIDVKSKIAKFVLRFGVLNLWKSKLLRKLTKNTWALLVLKTFTRNFVQIENKYFRVILKNVYTFLRLQIICCKFSRCCRHCEFSNKYIE